MSDMDGHMFRSEMEAGKATNNHTCKTKPGRFDSNATQPKQKSYRDKWHVGQDLARNSRASLTGLLVGLGLRTSMSEKQLSILFPRTGRRSRATVVNISVFSAHSLGDHVDNNSLKELVDSFFTTTENTRRSSFPTKPPPNLDPKSPQHRSYNQGAPRGHERRLGRHIGDQCPRPLPHTILTYTLMSPCT